MNNTTYSVKKSEIEQNTISNYCTNLDNIIFKEYADNFKLIDEKTVSLVIEQDEYSRELINLIKEIGSGNSRKLQRYSCSISQNEFDDLYNKQHVVDDYGSGIWCLTNQDYYDKNTGVVFEGKDKYV